MSSPLNDLTQLMLEATNGDCVRLGVRVAEGLKPLAQLELEEADRASRYLALVVVWRGRQASREVIR